MNIKAVASTLPDWVVDNPTIESWCGLPQSMLADKIGVHHRRFLAASETGTDLSERAVRNLAAANPDFDPARVGLLIVVTQNPDHQLPHNSALLQHRLGLAPTTACFDVSLGCSGFVYALSVAKGFMLAEGIDEALIVTCDPYSKCMSRANRDVAGLFGDAASATWLRADGRGVIGRGDFGTDGGGAGNLIVRAGGSAQPLAHLDGTPAADPAEADRFLHMNGRAIFNFMMTRVAGTVDSCLGRNGLSRDEVDFFVFHQASRYLLETLRDRMGLPPERMPITLAETGNTVSSTIPLVLEELLRDGRCAPATVLVSGFGVGLSWASNIIRFGA
ncbi:ketoacyl-ACP synthase III [Magnetospirillum sp. 15-1]|uniref:3-oxoacyl-ACP synthase III family protein n=1 Tax=Magnetospirillum sp. 15-1 TaxID=1979370 RepID=UPI000BBCB710|nr:ketoacyl-ACP synthase III [Magnetospirillum sp. 15-1]